MLATVQKIVFYLEDGSHVDNAMMKASSDLSDASLKIIEKALLTEIDALYQVLRDSYLQLLFLSAKLDNSDYHDVEMYEKIETHVLQLAALKKTLTADFKKPGQQINRPGFHNQSAPYEITRHGTVFQSLLK